MLQYFAFQWHITDYCDQRCKHCYIFAEGHPKLITVSLPDARRVIDNCVDMCSRMEEFVPYFYITGGDPVLHHTRNVSIQDYPLVFNRQFSAVRTRPSSQGGGGEA